MIKKAERKAMLKRLKPTKVIGSKEKFSNRIGVPFIKEVVRKFKLRETIEE